MSTSINVKGGYMLESPEIIKEDAVKLFRNKNRLALALGISRQAVEKWPDGEPIPERHSLKIRFILRPELWED